MIDYWSTSDIVQTAQQYSDAKSFFARLPDAWDKVSQSVLKLETRQQYKEPGNPSWEALARGDFEEALRLIPASRAVDVPLYMALRERRVEFIRCRPVRLPLTDYLRWEFACYDFNAAHGEQILCAAEAEVAALFKERLHHDFLVFDDRVALLHDYDSNGQIRGGWETSDGEQIAALKEMFQEFRVCCVSYQRFLVSMS